MGLRKADDACRASAQTPTLSGEDPTRTRPRASETREPREEADSRDQKECEEWTDGSVQDPGQGFSADEEIYREVLRHEDAVAGYKLENTGMRVIQNGM